MLYRTLKRMIQRGQTAGLKEKMGILLAVNSLTKAEYMELIEMLPAETETEENGDGDQG